MRYALLSLALASAFARTALAHCGAATTDEPGWIAGAVGWILAAGAGLTALVRPVPSTCRPVASRRPA